VGSQLSLEVPPLTEKSPESGKAVCNRRRHWEKS
jgi:hypothetical protein